MLMAPEIQWQLNSRDLMIAEASVEKPIRKYQDEELVSKIATMAKFICRDVGVSYWDDAQTMKYDATRFFDTLKKYYNDLSIKEIKMAFELASVGELDQWLPKDKYGLPDAKHYNSFNFEYYTKILNAYKSKLGKVWHTAKKLLPIPELVISEEQKKKNKEGFYNDIYQSFYLYKDKGIKPTFILSIFINEFIERGFIKAQPKPSKKTIEAVYRKQLLILKGSARRNLIDSYHGSGELSGVVLNEAQAIENNNAIAKYFDKVIKSKDKIENLIK